MYTKMTLNYDYASLEPYIDTHTMGLHYNKHYLGYLKNLNNLLAKNNYNYEYDLRDLVYHLDMFNKQDLENIKFNLGGVLNHELYWNSVSPKKNNVPVKSIKVAIENKYQNYENFKTAFTETAMSLKGSGYTFLVLKPNNDIEIVNTTNQHTPYMDNDIPLMTLDMWEHAYYINYENNKKEYIENFFDIVDYENINRVYEENKKIIA